MSHTPECHLKASQGIADRWHCPPHCPVEQERVAREALSSEMSGEYESDRQTLAIANYRAAILRSVREKVRGMQKDTTRQTAGGREEYPYCTSCKISEMYFEQEGHECDTHNATIDKVLALLDTEEGT